VHDGITLEKKGLPTACIVTSQFTLLANAQRTALGLPNYPLIVIKHPLASLKPEEVRERADGAIEEIIKVLTAPAEKLAQEYAPAR